MSSESGGGFPAIAALGPAIELANGLSNFFRKKTSISSIETATNDVGLASLIANELAQLGYKRVYFSANYPPRIKLADLKQSGTLKTIGDIRDLLKKVDDKIAEAFKARTASQERVAAAAKHLAAVTVAVNDLNDLNEEIKHLEALHKAAPAGSAAAEALGKHLAAKREAKVKVATEQAEARLAHAATEAAVKTIDGSIEEWKELKKTVDKVLAQFGEEESSAQLLAQLLRVEGLRSLGPE